MPTRSLAESAVRLPQEGTRPKNRSLWGLGGSLRILVAGALQHDARRYQSFK